MDVVQASRDALGEETANQVALDARLVKQGALAAAQASRGAFAAGLASAEPVQLYADRWHDLEDCSQSTCGVMQPY